MKREEEILQAKCYQWFHNTFPAERQMLFHVDNNSWNATIGAKKKALGVNAGVSDFVYILPQGRVAFIEMKTPDGIASDKQFEFMDKLNSRMHHCFIVQSFDEFTNLIRKLQNG